VPPIADHTDLRMADPPETAIDRKTILAAMRSLIVCGNLLECASPEQQDCRDTGSFVWSYLAQFLGERLASDHSSWSKRACEMSAIYQS
jgi:hypothetical protein